MRLYKVPIVFIIDFKNSLNQLAILQIGIIILYKHIYNHLPMLFKFKKHYAYKFDCNLLEQFYFLETQGLDQGFTNGQ